VGTDDTEKVATEKTNDPEQATVPTTIERVGSDVLVVRGFDDKQAVENLMNKLQSAAKSEKKFPIKPQAVSE
jgi:hypothetical protein